LINVKNSWAQGPFDNLITGNWDPKKELIPQNWIEPILNSTKAGIVPSPIVKALFELSNAQEDGYTPN
jgi:hypothetical protein